MRIQEGTDPESGQSLGILKVTDYMMATAQADANYSLTNIGHAQQFDIGENLAWGYSDPLIRDIGRVRLISLKRMYISVHGAGRVLAR